MPYTEDKLREVLAEIEHNQWMDWSKNIATVEKLTPERLERWQKLWRPYQELTEDEKDQDRKYADIVLSKFQSYKDELVEEIKRRKKDADGNGNTQWELGYEQACDDFINLIKNPQ